MKIVETRPVAINFEPCCGWVYAYEIFQRAVDEHGKLVRA